MHRRTLLSALPAAAFAAGLNPALAAVGKAVTIGIMGGEIDGTFLRVATDLTSVLNSNDMRIVPIVGKGSLQNIGELLHLPGVDLALVAADALTYAQTAHLYPGELGKIQYICKLYENDVHVCARPEIQSLSDLQGKPVNIDVDGAGTNLTARAVLKILGITPDLRTDEPGIGQEKLKRGEIAANIYAAGKPVRLFATAPGRDRPAFHPHPLERGDRKGLCAGRFAYARRIPDAGPGRRAGRDGGRWRYACGFRMAAGFGSVPEFGQFRRCVFHEVSGTAEAAAPSGVAQCQSRCRAARVDPVSGGRGVACTAPSCGRCADTCRCENAGAIRGLSYAARRSATDAGAERGHLAILPAATGTGA